MKNSRALFISVAITAFILVMLGGVFSVYQAFASSGTQLAQLPPAILEAPPTPLISPTAETALQSSPVIQVTPEEAAVIASQFIGRQDAYTVEPAKLNEIDVYKVTFRIGDIVFVGMDGQVLSVVPHQPIASNYNYQPGQQSNPSQEADHQDGGESEHDD